MSILLLQLLCLPPCCVPVDVFPLGEKNEESTEPLYATEDYYLRSTQSSSLSYLSSFLNGLYTLLRITSSYKNEPSPFDEGHGESKTPSVLLDAKTIKALEDFEGEKVGDWRGSHELPRENRRLGKKKRIGQQNSRTVSMLWYVDWINAQCVQSCDPRTTTNPNCAGLAVRENFLFNSAKLCCKTMIPWKTYDMCTRVGSPDGTLNQVYQDIDTPVNNWGNVMSNTPANNVQVVSSKTKPMSTAQTFSQSKPQKTEIVSKDPTPQKGQVVPKSSCWRSGMSCASEAQKFACCGVCSNGVCI